MSAIPNRWTLSIWTDVLFRWMTLLMKFLKPRFCRWSWCQTASLFKVAATRGDPNRYRQLRATRLGMPWILGFGGQDPHYKWSIYRSIILKNRFKNFEECCIPLGVSRPNFFATAMLTWTCRHVKAQPETGWIDLSPWNDVLPNCFTLMRDAVTRICSTGTCIWRCFTQPTLYAAYGTSFGSVCVHVNGRRRLDSCQMIFFWNLGIHF